MSDQPFDARAWAVRQCKFTGNRMFHSHPELPCTKLCFSDLWASMIEEYGTHFHRTERVNVVFDPKNPELTLKILLARWDKTERLLTAKRIEYKRRMEAI